jgi:glycosyltransferase involved in cell wall biosynthesis
MKLLVCVHAYPPKFGGSESNTHNIAVECLKRGHDVHVLVDEKSSRKYEGIHVWNNMAFISEKWDLIIIHGSNIFWQNECIKRACNSQNRVLWMPIRPMYSKIDYYALSNCDYIGCATHIDYNFAAEFPDKIRMVRLGIPASLSVGKEGFKDKYNITGKMVFSAGGYALNKDMKNLKEIFMEANLEDTTLVITGYNDFENKPESNERVLCLESIPRKDLNSAYCEADLYISHSYAEGFGLCLLESMVNETPWIAKDGWYDDGYHVGVVKDLVDKDMGISYTTKEEFIDILRNQQYLNIDVERNKDKVYKEYSIQNTIDNIEAIL